MADSGEEWELSKENIRPIQQGRKQKVLKVALASHPEEIISQQRQSFENELRTYSGDDPLFLWCKYIKWVEQNYPKGGKEGHIKQLMERCLSILKDEQKYFDDDRFVDIMLKYAGLSGKPLEVYNYMYSSNIGCKSAKFFISWSWELEQIGNMKKADEILIEGMNRRAQPFEKLKSYYADFEIRLVTKIKANIETNHEPESNRSAFAVLKPQKKNLAPISRTGEAVVEKTSSLLLNRHQPQPKSIKLSTKVPFKIYDSENINPSLPVQTQSGARSSLNPENYKENERKPSKWNKVKMKSHGIFHETNPDFKFHCDDEKDDQFHTPRSVPKTSNILSSRRRTPSPPIALFEPPDPMKKPMYPKNKVYGGAEEYSLEEIRAVAWFDCKKKAENEKLLAEQQRKIEEQAKEQEELKKQVEFLAKKLEMLQNHASNAKLCEVLSDGNPPAFDYAFKNNQKEKMAVNTDGKTFPPQFQNSNLESFNHNSVTEKNIDTSVYNNADRMIQEMYNKSLPQPTRNVESQILDFTKDFNKKASIFTSTKNDFELSQSDQCNDSIKQSCNKLPFTFFHDPTTNIIPVQANVSSKEVTNNILAKDIDKLHCDSQSSLSTSTKNELSQSNQCNDANKLPFTFFHDPTTKLMPDQAIVSSKEVINTVLAKDIDKQHSVSQSSLSTSIKNEFELSKSNQCNDVIKQSGNKLPFTFFHDPTTKIAPDPINVSSKKVANTALTKDLEKLHDASQMSENLKSTNQNEENFPEKSKSAFTSNKGLKKQNESNVSEAQHTDKAPEPSNVNNLPFTFYCDPTNTVSNVETAPEKHISKEHPHEELLDDDNENVPPEGYIQDKTKRELAGILEPSKNVLFIPLEEQELGEDDNESDFEDFIYQDGRCYSDETLIPPSNTEQFSTAKFIASTPCVNKPKKGASSVKPNQILAQNLPNPSENFPTRNNLTNENTATKTEIKVHKESVQISELKTTSNSRLSKMLSVIMETSENYSKSSSSSSSGNLTKSHHLDQNSVYHMNMNKHHSKFEPREPSISSISENSSQNSKQFHNSVIKEKLNEEDANKPEIILVDFDPFDSSIIQKLLKSIKFDRYKNLCTMNKSIRSVKMSESIQIGNETYIIDNLIAEGAYAKVYKAIKPFDMSDSHFNKPLALKVCKKANEWEFYICSEIQRRLLEKKSLPDIKDSVMNIIAAIKYYDGMLLVNEYGSLGTLLDVINFYKKQNSSIPELLAMFFTLQMLIIISKLHECNIIHGDIKPDNFLLTSAYPGEDALNNIAKSTSCVRLIDFGRAIDLNLFDKGICFTTTFSKNDFKCNEMKEEKPWVFQLDWYGVLSCVHTLLFQEYMSVKKTDGVWKIEKKFKRYWFNSLWEPLFHKLLNIPKCYEEPDVKFFISIIESKLQQNASNFLGQFSRFSDAYSKRK